jgi:hypothetical protein
MALPPDDLCVTMAARIALQVHEIAVEPGDLAITPNPAPTSSTTS